MELIIELIIDPAGSVRCLYTEALELRRLGTVEIRRASHVDADGHGRWHADLSPVGGPRLGPFATRSAALASEATWLSQHLAAPHTHPPYPLNS
jgi:hypothetical protein